MTLTFAFPYDLSKRRWGFRLVSSIPIEIQAKP